MSKKPPPFGPLTAITRNQTKPGFKEKREGFDPSNPNVGTVTHEFRFTADPWVLISNTGARVCTLATVILSVVKVFNPNNTTDSFVTVSWTPDYPYGTSDLSAPTMTLKLYDENQSKLQEADLFGLGVVCGTRDTQSKKTDIDSKYFDRIKIGELTLGAAVWYPC